MNLKRYFYNIPITLCALVAKQKLYPSFRTYLYLKFLCSGQMNITVADKKKIAKSLGITTVTLKNHLEKLQARNWVGYNPKSGMYFIRGFSKVMQIEKLKGRRGVGMSIEDDLLKNKQQFYAFIAGALIGYLVKIQNWKKKYLSKSEYSTGNSNHNFDEASSNVPRVACNALQQLYDISRGTAHKFKQEANKYKYITLDGNLDFMKLEPSEVAFYKAAHPDIAGRIKVRKGLVYLQVPDKVTALLEYPKRRKYKIKLS